MTPDDAAALLVPWAAVPFLLAAAIAVVVLACAWCRAGEYDRGWGDAVDRMRAADEATQWAMRNAARIKGRDGEDRPAERGGRLAHLGCGWVGYEIDLDSGGRCPRCGAEYPSWDDESEDRP